MTLKPPLYWSLMSQKKKTIWLIAGLLAIMMLGFSLNIFRQPMEQSYGFIKATHPVSMTQAGPDKWAYYFLPIGTKDAIAKDARAELISEGFVEDKSNKWFSFRKGNVEVDVCNHTEFGLSNTGLVAMDSPPTTEQPYACVLVKNGLGTHSPQLAFEAQKLVHGW